MDTPTVLSFDGLARWQTATPGPVLRGRRADGGDTTVHFLSGNGFCGGVYWPMLRGLLPDYGLFLHDVEGQGESDAPTHFSGADAVVERAAAVIHEQGLAGKPLIGMGHSFGSQLTVLLAARHPGLFKALVLTDPILFPPLFWLGIRAMAVVGQHPFGKGARRRRDAWPSREAAMNHLRGRGIYKGWTEEAFTCFIDHAMVRVPRLATAARSGTERPATDGRAAVADTRNGFAGDGGDEGYEWRLRCPKVIEAEIFEQPAYPWKAWRKLDLPVLFLRGAQSYPFFPAAERWARRLKPDTVFQQLPGGHCFMQEDPAAAAGAIRDFLRKLG